jgi:cell division protein ZapD
LILYEYPLNERVRTLLRLEDLFERLQFFVSREHPHEHHVALTTLFEILDVASRADLKSDLLQELERQRQTLLSFRDAPEVSGDALSRVLAGIDDAWQRLSDVAGKSGQHLRDNEWLMSIRSRTIIPGGACEFDLPSYHAWLHRSAQARLADIDGWVSPFAPLRDALRIVLRLLRESGQRSNLVAAQGSYQQVLGGKQFQLLQIRLSSDDSAIPEISANKYQLWIRFTTQGGDLRPRPAEATCLSSSRSATSERRHATRPATPRWHPACHSARMPTTVDCPTCGRRVEWTPASKFRPFCSERCKMVDLGAWATERYSVPGDAPTDPAGAADPPSSPRTTAEARRRGSSRSPARRAPARWRGRRPTVRPARTPAARRARPAPRSRSQPKAGAPGCEAVGRTGPSIAKSAPSRAARANSASSWQDAPTSRTPAGRSPQAARSAARRCTPSAARQYEGGCALDTTRRAPAARQASRTR